MSGNMVESETRVVTVRLKCCPRQQSLALLLGETIFLDGARGSPVSPPFLFILDTVPNPGAGA